MGNFEDDLADLSSAEDFLSYFGIEYDASVVHVNRLHILQRYHDYLERSRESIPDHEAAGREIHRALLTRAYRDFVESSALDERVFKVLKDAKGEAFVPLTKIEGAEKS